MRVIDYIIEKAKSQYEAFDQSNIKLNVLNALPFWVGAFVTGLVAVLYAELFSLAEKGTHYIYQNEKWMFFIITPFCFALAWFLVTKYAPYARGSGIPQVSASIDLSTPVHHLKVNKLLSLRIIVVKISSSLIMIFGGGVIGREGPTIQISAAIFKKINDWLPAWYPKISKRNMIITGAAAGLASAFNTPLGGIVFAIEELTKTHIRFFKSALLTGVIIAGLTALNLFGPYLYIGYPKLDRIAYGIVFAVIVVALFSGLAGSGMGQIILWIFKKKKVLKKKSSQVMYVIGCGLIIAALAYFIDGRVFGSGKDIVVNALFTDNKEAPWYLPILRIVGPIISFSTGISGGIFAPSLSAGASVGAFISSWFDHTDAEANLIILCGMVGFLTGITRSPFTSSILVIEMANCHNIIFNLMLTALIANIISNLVSRRSFYDNLKVQYISEVTADDPPGTKQVGEEEKKMDKEME
jgi:H+/Cl- antiporter ClcA